MDLGIQGKTALVAAASDGLGKGVALRLAVEGVNVAICGRNPERLEAAVDEIRRANPRVGAYGYVADLGSAPDIACLGEQLSDDGIGVDILVNNAGLVIPCAIEAASFEASWDTSIAVMATAQAWAIRCALPALRQSANPRIVNVASTEALGATAHNSSYIVAKHASVGLTRAMAVDLGREGITVNCVCPGPIRTAITAQIPEEDKAVFARRRTALRRYGDPEEVAHAILSLVLPASGFITGATLVVDGGLTIRNA